MTSISSPEIELSSNATLLDLCMARVRPGMNHSGTGTGFPNYGRHAIPGVVCRANGDDHHESAINPRSRRSSPSAERLRVFLVTCKRDVNHRRSRRFYVQGHLDITIGLI